MWNLRPLSATTRAPRLRRVPPVYMLGAILLLGLALRLWLAPMEGYGFDVGVNQGWAKSAVLYGVAASYSEQVGGNMTPNYPPISLLIFTGVGYVFRMIDPAMPLDAMTFRILIKLPSILADLLTCVLIFGVLRRTRSAQWGLLGAGIYAIHPAVLYDSAVWGQSDALFVVPVLCAVVALHSERFALGGALLAIAALTKIQAVIFLPLLLLAHHNPRGLLRGCVAGAATTALVLAPFVAGGALNDVLNVYHGAVGYYSNISVGAYNFWWALMADRAWELQDTETLFGTVTYHTAGLTAFAIAYVLIGMMLVRGLRTLVNPKHKLELTLLGSGLIGLAFFLFNTQMHERYMFPFLALALPWALRSSTNTALYALVSVGAFFNLMGVLPLSGFDRFLYSTFPTFDVLMACAMLFGFTGLLWNAWHRPSGV